MSEKPPEKQGVQKGVVSKELAGALVDGAVRALFNLSWGRARDLVKRGKILVNGKVMTVGTVRVYEGAEIELRMNARDPRIDKESLPPDSIVHLDAHVVVVNKPSGIATLPFADEGMGASLGKRSSSGGRTGDRSKSNDELTLVERVRAVLSRREKTKGPPRDLGVVHRLDKETSGLIVFTRSWAAKKTLSQAFRFHHVHRRYIALVNGVMAQDELTIESHFVPNRGDGLRGSVEKRGGRNYALGNEHTQRAVTHLRVLERFENSKATLVQCELETGRTHQIRIHLAEEGHPIVGERVYTRGMTMQVIAAPRVMLHAAELGFVHPQAFAIASSSGADATMNDGEEEEIPDVDEDADSDDRADDDEAAGEQEMMEWTCDVPEDMAAAIAAAREAK